MKPARIGALTFIVLALLAASSSFGSPGPATEAARLTAEPSSTACEQARAAMVPALQLAQAAIEKTSAGDARLASISTARDMLTSAHVIATVNACLTADRAAGTTLTDVCAGVDEAVLRISEIRTTGRATADDRVALTRVLGELNTFLAP
ncbi:hypothetical protein AB0F88_16785 [Streptosporangium sp. NPDC023963]|uniref:hypothetical protein n=1 Tax=Streptosporangium sp. NPDC023963 TaxID=3155608 RepID=UPI003424D674